MTNLTVANTILSQIAASTRLTCGMRDYVGGVDSLTFRVTIEQGKAHKIVVRLDASDTYTVQLWRIKKYDAVMVKEMGDVYNDMLSSTIYDMCNR